jgi:hypothetical protein
MRMKIRRNDIWRLSPLVVLAQRVPAQLVTNDPRYLHVVAGVPSWVFPFTVGFAIAVWVIDPWTQDSRLKQLWRWLTDSFDVEWLHAGSTQEIGELELVAMVRFRRRVRRAKLWLHVLGNTHRGLKPLEQMRLIEELHDIPRGYRKRITIATVGIPMQGWDHAKPRGWAGSGGPGTVLGKSGNVVSLKLVGPLVTQEYRMFVELEQHIGNAHKPHLTVISEEDDLFDASETGHRSVLRV